MIDSFDLLLKCPLSFPYISMNRVDLCLDTVKVVANFHYYPKRFIYLFVNFYYFLLRFFQILEDPQWGPTSTAVG